MDKLKGWVVSNGYLKTSKYIEIIALYEAAAVRLGISLERFFNNELLFGIEQDNLFIRGDKAKYWPDFILFLDKDIRLAYQLEEMGIRLFNSPRVIELCDDKSRTFQALAKNNIRMPKTIIAPLVYKGFEETSNDTIDRLESELAYPMIVKESYGSFGEQVYLIQNRDELISKRKQLLSTAHIYQEFIASSRGRDVRINIVGDQVVASMIRTSKTDFRANISNGGSMENYKPSKAFEELALQACKLIGADFAGIDLLFGKDEEPLLCEINSSSHIKNIQLCSGIDVAEHILKYILKELIK